MFTSGVRLYSREKRPYCRRCAETLPFCHHCEAPTEKYTVKKENVQCDHCWHSLHECHVCQTAGLEKYWTYVGSPIVRFCIDCKDHKFGPCAQCGEPDLLGEDAYCELCGDTAVQSLEEAYDICDQVLLFLENEFNMLLEREIEIQLIKRNPDHDGLYRRFGESHLIDIVDTLPVSVFTGVLAHELTHAWQNEHCYMGEMSKELLEGFACWIEHKVMFELGWDHNAQLLESCTQAHYGPGLRKCLDWETALGEEGLIEALRTWTDFPSRQCLCSGAAA